MKNNWIKIAGAAVAALAVTASLQATVITGGIGIAGAYTANGTAGDLTTATSMTIAGPFTAVNESGTFIGAINSTITFASPIAVNPANNLTPNKVLWTVEVGTTTYTFTVTSESESVDTANQVTLIGQGTFTDGNSADTAFGTYQLGFGVTQTTFSFQNNSQTNVPDGGTTAMLLGTALMGLGLLKKKLMA
jgi:VPDSG-CTERM motif